VTNGIASNVTEVSKSLISSLPAQFLVLVLTNAIFIVGLLWFLDRSRQAEENMLLPVLTSCIQEVPVEALRHLQLELKGGKP
jgi:hypothetical protein